MCKKYNQFCLSGNVIPSSSSTASLGTPVQFPWLVVCMSPRYHKFFRFPYYDVRCKRRSISQRYQIALRYCNHTPPFPARIWENTISGYKYNISENIGDPLLAKNIVNFWSLHIPSPTVSCALPGRVDWLHCVQLLTWRSCGTPRRRMKLKLQIGAIITAWQFHVQVSCVR